MSIDRSEGADALMSGIDTATGWLFMRTLCRVVLLLDDERGEAFEARIPSRCCSCSAPGCLPGETSGPMFSGDGGLDCDLEPAPSSAVVSFVASSKASGGR
jgi:hypothetical protein